MRAFKLTIAIVIPAYNEEKTIRGVIHDFHRILPEAELYVIDNNSNDRTYQIAEETLAQVGASGRVIQERRQGKANAIRRAFAEIDADIYVMTDADLTYPAKEAEILIQPVIRDEAEMVVGDRISNGRYHHENKRPFHGFGNALVARIINVIFNSKLNDIMSGYRVFSRKFVKTYPILVEGFELETDLTLHALDKKFRITEIPITYQDRPEGSFSKLNTFSDGFRVLWNIFRIFKDYRPLFFFGSLAVLFALGGIAAGIPVVFEYLETRFITRVPLAILATGLMIVALVTFAIGTILDTVVKIHRFNYELELLRFEGEAQRQRHKRAPQALR